MTNSILMIMLASASILSCKKSVTDSIPPPATLKVAIGGKEYPAVKIGSQWWTTTNYAGAGGIAFNAADTKPFYGKYYSLAEMEEVVTPAGWHVPSTADFKKLAAYAGVRFNDHTDNTAAVRKLTTSSGWLNIPGTNALGFIAYPAGYIATGIPPADGDNAEFWTTDGNTFSMMEAGNKTTLLPRFYLYNVNTSDRFNIRFVKNE